MGPIQHLLSHAKVPTKIAIMVLLPSMGMLYFAADRVVRDRELADSQSKMVGLSTLAASSSNLVHEIQKERGLTAGFLAGGGASVGALLEKQRTEMDARMADLASLVSSLEPRLLAQAHAEKGLVKALDDLKRVQTVRSQVDSQEIGLGAAIKYYSAINGALLSVVSSMARYVPDGKSGASLAAYYSLLYLKERAGIERAVLSSAFAAGDFAPGMRNKFISMLALQNGYKTSFVAFANPGFVSALHTNLSAEVQDPVTRFREIAAKPAPDGGFGIDPKVWFAAATRRIEALRTVEVSIAKDIRTAAEQDVAAASTKANASTAAALGLLALCIGLAWIVARSIVEPLKEALSAMEGVAKGDLTRRVHAVGTDEVGRMGRAMNQTLEGIRGALGQDQVSWATIADERAQAAARVEQERWATEELQRKVDILVKVVNDAADGDLVQRVSVQGDDGIGRVGKGISRMLNETRNRMEQIGNCAHTLAAAAEELSAISEHMTSSIQSNSLEAARASENADRVGDNVSAVASTINQMNHSIQDIAHNATSASEVAGNASEVTQTAQQRVQKLAARTNEINAVLDVITNIAQQTNLLALNATIEAASAGDRGRGFAVVANEVKQLAYETSKATDQISSLLEATQRESDDALVATQELGQIIKQINSTQASIAGAVEEQTTAAQNIGQSVAETSESTQAIVESISQVAAGSAQTSSGAQDAMAASAELARMAAELHSMVGGFKLHESNAAEHDLYEAA